MNTSQYTIRNVPLRLDRVLRKRAKLTGKSLNQLVIEDIAAQNNVVLSTPGNVPLQSLSWFIGLGALDNDVLQAINYDDKLQKERMRREFESDT